MEKINGTALIIARDGRFIREELDYAARVLRQGGLVAFPTETVYGLGADGLNPAATAKIFAAKGRPNDNPLILHVASYEGLRPLVKDVPPLAKILGERFWPGPLTMVFHKSEMVNTTVTGGLDTVAIRMPDHPVALQLLAEAAVPVAAPSANISGRPSPTRVEHVMEDLLGKVDVIIDGGRTGVGVESTVVDVTGKFPVLLRPGGVTLEELEEAAGEVVVDPAILRMGKSEDIVARAPGMKYTHYAPVAEVILVEGNFPAQVEEIQKIASREREAGRKVGIMATAESEERYRADVVLNMGTRYDLATVAENIFDRLREFDARGVDLIVVEGVELKGMGLAVMNRLRKAAGYQIVKV